MFTGQLAQPATSNFQRSQDTLFSLGKDTGGKALFDFNDLSLGIRQAADGKCRRVKVSLAGGLSADVSARPGYFADKEFAKFTAADKEKRPIQYETGFTLLPGKYVITYLVRDAETGRMGTYQSTFTVPLRCSVSLDKLPPGQYDCQVTVLDPTGQKANFWSAPIVLVP